MKKIIIPVAIILIMVISSFGAIGNNLEKEFEKDIITDEEKINNNEYQARGLGIINCTKHEIPGDTVFPETAPLGNFDWRDAEVDGVQGNWISPVKSQGACGSCWAFSTIGVIESVINIKNKDPDLDLDLSEQYMVSCCDYNAEGCDGAYINTPLGQNYLDWTKIFDAIPEDKFEYSASNEACSNKDNDFYKYKVEVNGWDWVDGSIDQMKNALKLKGPLVAIMQVYSDFYGEYPDQSKWPDDVYYHKDGIYLGDHAVVIVGYGSNYWICKNSWGKYWGLNGYFKIKFGEVGINDNLAYIDCDKYVDPDDATVTVELYKIKALDGFEEWPDWTEADWSWQVAMDGSGTGDRWEDNHNKISKIQSYRWKTYKDKVDITIKLKDIDDGPFALDDLADISEKHGSEPYYNQEPSWSKFPGPITFKVSLDRNKPYLQDALTGDRFDYASESGWTGYKTSGNFDGGSGDELDAEVWFNIEYETTGEEDLLTDGSLNWINVGAGERVYSFFTVENDGNSNTKLDWEIDSYPEWGQWVFTPSHGEDLIPEDGEQTIQVSVRAPYTYYETHTGEVKVVNKNNKNDYGTIKVTLSTSRNKAINNNVLLRFLDDFPILKNIFYSLIDNNLRVIS